MPLQEELEIQGNWLFKNRSYLPIVILIIGAFMVYIREINTYGLPISRSYQLLCVGVGLLGLLIRIYTVGYTPDNTSGRNVAGQVADVVNTKGIYSMVRHPLYLGNFFMWLGAAMVCANLWFIIAFCFFYGMYYERIMYAEEQYLRKKFDAAYINWASVTPAFFPAFSKFVSSDVSFNWKKVIKNEKNGIVGLFLIFLLFDAIGAYVNPTRGLYQPLIICALLSLIWYIIIKVLTKTTDLLT